MHLRGDVHQHLLAWFLSSGLARHVLRMGRRPADGGTAGGSCSGDARRRSHRRRGVGSLVPSADSHSLPLYLVYGGFRLYVARCIHDGQADAQYGTPRQVVYPVDYGFRLQCSCNHVDPHYREPPVASHHDADTAADEL